MTTMTTLSLVFAWRFGGLEGKKRSTARRLEESAKDSDKGSSKDKDKDKESSSKDKDKESSSMMLEPEEEGNLILGSETAFLAEGSVHDTGGMVEWAGTVRKCHQIDSGIDILIFLGPFFRN